MKPGDVCKCISDFTGLHSGELTLCKNDIVQIHKVIDKLWLEGQGGGNHGRFPSSIIVETEIPPFPSNAALYVALADFHPVQEGDLPLMRGTFVIEINPIDQDWAYGESCCSKGIFPLNYVWKIDTTLFSRNDGMEKQVRMRARVLSSIKAQLPEELNLYAGEMVTITHVLDDDWYRGESHGEKGIFPSSFVEIISECIDEEVVDERPLVVDDSPAPSSSQVDQNIPDLPDISLLASDSLLGVNNDCSNKRDKISQDNAAIKDDDLFDDDYFRLNLPNFYSSNQSSKNEMLPALAEHKIKDQDTLLPLDSLSAEVEKYFTDESHAMDSGSINQDLIDIDFTYTEDNTGINPYGRAVFTFTAQYANELSFRKGDIIHLIRHIDSHWTVGKLGIVKGIFPTSYIDIIVECPYKAEDIFEKRSESSFAKKAIVCFDFAASAPEDASGKEGDVVLITKFVSENWVEVETASGQRGLFPLNRLNVLQDESSGKEVTSESNPKVGKRNYVKEDFQRLKRADIEEVLSKNISSLDISFKHSKPMAGASKTTSVFGECIDEAEEPLMSKAIAPSLVQEKEGTPSPSEPPPSESPPLPPLPLVLPSNNTPKQIPRPQRLPIIPPRTSVVQKPNFETRVSSPPKRDSWSPSDKKPTQITAGSEDEKETSIAELTSSRSLSRDASLMNAEFPDDVSSSSLSQHSNSMKENESISSELNPQRPAPPLPLPHSDSETEEEFSLPSEREDVPNTVTRTEEAEGSPESGEEETLSRKKLHLRRESVNELVTTEHEYVHDLESLIQVVRIGKSQKEAADVELKVLMGNIDQVVELSKKFIKELNRVSYNEDEELMIGPVFLSLADEMCDVYKVYSSNNSISVAPLLQKYQQGGSSAVFLKWILTELRQHKVNLLDMQAVLIKPVQRVLKYPLFIDNLVQNTPPTHPDYRNLEEARKVMLNVAKEINEYTKRLDLVRKYRHSSHHSLGEKIQRVSMRAVAKKGSRIRTRISATMGFIAMTKDLKFEEEEARFRSVVKSSAALAEQGHKLVEAIKKRHRAELGIIEAVASALLLEARDPQIEAIRSTCRDTCNNILPVFERNTLKRVIEPCRALLAMCSAPEHLIQKRYDKLLDFDKAQHKLDKNRDSTRTRILEEELKRAQGTYEAMNLQLLMDLPRLNEEGIAVLLLAMKSLVSARMNLEGRVANLYLELAQVKTLSNLSNEEYLNNFKLDYTSQINTLKRLSFVSADFTPKSPKFGRRKSSLRKSLTRRDDKKRLSVEKVSEKVPLSDRYDASMIYVVKMTHPAEETFDLFLSQGTPVGVIKMKDPSGSSRRWFVDDGTQQGFVRTSYLEKSGDAQSPGMVRESVSREDPVPTIPSVPSLAHPDRRSSSQPVTSSEVPVVPEAPPRYEDIFPPDASVPGDETNRELEEENIYEEIDQGKDDRYENIGHDDREDPPQNTPAADGAEATPKEKQILFAEPDEAASQFYHSLYNFGGGDSNQLPLHEGQVVLLLFAQGSEWWFVEDREGQRGYVPAAYLSKYT